MLGTAQHAPVHTVARGLVFWTKAEKGRERPRPRVCRNAHGAAEPLVLGNRELDLGVESDSQGEAPIRGAPRCETQRRAAAARIACAEMHVQ